MISNDSDNLIWICRSCCWNANIDIWNNGYLLGDMYRCKSCGITGWMSDPDAPIQVTNKEADDYWLELQTDSTFISPRDNQYKGNL